MYYGNQKNIGSLFSYSPDSHWTSFGDDQNMELYESNIPPLLRFFHVVDIEPSHWVYIPKMKYKKISRCGVFTVSSSPPMMDMISFLGKTNTKMSFLDPNVESRLSRRRLFTSGPQL